LLSARDLCRDLLGEFEDIRTLAFLASPDPDVEVRRNLLARVGLLLLDAIEHDWFFGFLKQAVIASADGVPPVGTLQRITSDSSNDPAVRRKIENACSGIIGGYLRYVKVEAIRNLSGREAMFWHCMLTKEARARANELRVAATDHILDRLVTPNGGLPALACPDTGVESTEVELLGFPMLAGLALLLIASLDKPESRKNASLNFALEIIDASVSLSQASTERRRLKGEEVWHKWRPYAPIWAGVIAEAIGEDFGAISHEDLLISQISDVVLDEGRRRMAFGYSIWFSFFASNTRHEKSPKGTVHIPADEVIWLPEAVGAAPTLPILPPSIFETVFEKRRQREEAARLKRKERAEAAILEKLERAAGLKRMERKR
jgi:hypothetical protein